MESSASASSNEAIDQILKKIQTFLEKQSPSESEIDILRKVISDQQQLGIVIHYFSLFPQGYEFDAERLIDLWIAEGFFNSSEEGGRYLNYLVGSSILQNVKKDEFDQVRSCIMHPRMHNIAEFVDSYRENIMITKANPTGTNDDSINDDSNAVWRASFYSSNSQVHDELYSKAKQLKSIFFFNTVELQEGKLDGILKKIFKNFKKLCVLDLRDLGIKGVPSSIGDLKDLKYLDLSKNKMKKLPSSIAKLSNLHTLKLFGCHDLEELPKDFKNLGELKHLDIEECWGLTGMPREMSKLSSLQTLPAFVASKKETMGGLEELAQLNKLRGNLEILHLDRVQCSSFENMEKKFLLEKLEHLQHLTLSWNLEGDKKGEKDHLPLLESLKPHSKLGSLILVGFQGPSLPVWFTSLESLDKLSLQDCHEFKYLSKQDDQLPNLKILELVKLKHLKYITQECNKEASFYKSLEEMTIKDCPMLKSLWENETEENETVLQSCTLELQRLNTMSIPLKNLLIQDCSDLTNLSGVFQHLSSLQCLTIENCHTISLEGESKAWESLKSLRFLTLKGFSKLSSLSFGEGVTTLEELTLENCLKLTSISDIGTLNSMQKLTLRSCGWLTSISDIGTLTSLQELTLENCPKLTSISDIGTLTSMQKLTLRSCGGLTSISDIGTLTSLQELTLENCPKLTSISDSKGQDTSLRSLEISKCNKLKSLPKTIFKSLQTLRILNCDSLQPMFVKDTGDYFPLICHIKDLQVKTTLQG